MPTSLSRGWCSWSDSKWLAGHCRWKSLANVAALLFGIAFQYLAIAPMRGLGVRAGLIAAAKADVLSLTAFQVGMFGWMILTSLVLFIPPLHPDSPVYWFMMQIGMVVGFATSWPANVWLIKRGIKEAMWENV